MTERLTRAATWLRIFCAALLLCLGLAHKPVYATPSADPASSFYLLPDGTFADLCFDNAVHGKPGKHWLGSGCEVCRLSASIALPARPFAHAPVDKVLFHLDFAFYIVALDRTFLWVGTPVRGPPFFAV